jgi:hypothetical protein
MGRFLKRCGMDRTDPCFKCDVIVERTLGIDSLQILHMAVSNGSEIVKYRT